MSSSNVAEVKELINKALNKYVKLKMKKKNASKQHKYLGLCWDALMNIPYSEVSPVATCSTGSGECVGALYLLHFRKKHNAVDDAFFHPFFLPYLVTCQFPLSSHLFNIIQQLPCFLEDTWSQTMASFQSGPHAVSHGNVTHMDESAGYPFLHSWAQRYAWFSSFAVIDKRVSITATCYPSHSESMGRLAPSHRWKRFTVSNDVYMYAKLI